MVHDFELVSVRKASVNTSFFEQVVMSILALRGMSDLLTTLNLEHLELFS
jgi:hypothetical protein